MSSSSSTRAAAQCCKVASRTQTRSLSSQCLRLSSSSSYSNLSIHQKRRTNATRQQRRWDSTAAASTNPKISSIVDQISTLTLLETADLVASLKSRLNIPDMAFAAPSAGPATGAGAAAPAAVEEEEAAPAAQEKTLFTLKLEKFDAAAKPKVIKEIKSMLGLSLVDSKKFVESAPKMMKEGVPKDEAEKIIATMKALGAEVKME